MYKIVLPLIFGVLLNAELINGVSVVVKGDIITQYDIKEHMRLSNIDAEGATDALIRKKLEESEINERRISVSNNEVYDEIKKIASINKLSVSEFYEAVRNSNGLTSTELKEKTKENLLSQKLYAAIAYSGIDSPSEDETREYYELHKEQFLHPVAFRVIMYTTQNREALEKKIKNPINFSKDIVKHEQMLPYDKISQELADLLEKTELNSFTKIISDSRGSYTSFYLKDIQKHDKTEYQDVKEQMVNMIMAQKREQVLSDYFARLRGNADIQIIREVK